MTVDAILAELEDIRYALLSWKHDGGADDPVALVSRTAERIEIQIAALRAEWAAVRNEIARSSWLKDRT